MKGVPAGQRPNEAFGWFWFWLVAHVRFVLRDDGKHQAVT